ncbi:MAG: glycosyltransferase [Dysgonamonadaceae bacterium]|nr:glycosyltransferase [Dysgonamonadaceae bacterium]
MAKFLFVVQGEGRGHITQAMTLNDILTENGHEVAAILVGKSNRRELPKFFTQKFNSKVCLFDSPNFLPASKNKKTNLWASIIYNLFKFGAYVKSIFFIHRQIKKYDADIVVNFYDLMAGLTYLFFPPKIPLFCIAHQYIFLHPEYRFPNTNKIELRMLKFFTRITCAGALKLLALSTKKMPDIPERRIFVVPPLLRKDVREAQVSDGHYLHGYMLNDTYADGIIRFQEEHPDVSLHFFWDRKGAKRETVINDRLSFHNLNDKLFIKYMAGCKAYATTAGFESVCEAIYMGKPVLTVPTHIEQACNAFETSQLGAGVVDDNFNLEKLLEYIPKYRKQPEFKDWVEQADEYILNVFAPQTASDST